MKVARRSRLVKTILPSDARSGDEAPHQPELLTLQRSRGSCCQNGMRRLARFRALLWIATSRESPKRRYVLTCDDEGRAWHIACFLWRPYEFGLPYYAVKVSGRTLREAAEPVQAATFNNILRRSNVAKQMVFDDEARQPLLAGVSKLARAVRSTLGQIGRAHV